MYKIDLSYEDLNTIEDALAIAFEQENEFRDIGENYLFLAQKIRKIIDKANERMN